MTFFWHGSGLSVDLIDDDKDLVLGAVEFDTENQRFTAFDYTKYRHDVPARCVILGPYETMEEAQDAVEHSVRTPDA